MEGIPDDLWSPYKHLYKIIERTLTNPNEISVNDLELCFRKYKQNLSSILKNPPKNERHRSQLLNGITDGISLSGQNRTVLLSRDLVDESIIISDMFDLDEFHALELLCTAQRQISQHPGLPRGLIAILLYYDGRRAISFSLRDLFQVSNGVSWVTDVPKEISLLVTTYCQSLVDEFDVLGRIIDILEDLEISKEIVLLTKNRALGNKKHQNQIQNLFEDIRLGLATALFNWSAQRGLSKSNVVKLIRCLSKYKSMEATGVIDDVMLTMLMALLFSFDTSIIHREEDPNNYFKILPIINDPTFVQHVYDCLSTDPSCAFKYRLDSIAKFAFGLSLASLRHAPQNIQSLHSKLIERDEQLVDDALNNKIFECLYYHVLEQKNIFKNEFFYRRLHMLFTDFIDYMHSKVTELRGKADDTAKTVASFAKEGLEPPTNLDHNFEMLLLCIGKFYKDNRAGLSLCVEYWGPFDITSSYSKTTSRSVSLFKFIRLAGELLPSTLFVPYLKMIAGLTSCERSARNAFNLLKQQTGLSGSATLSWEHFFGSLARYYSFLRQEQSPGGDTIYRNRTINRSINPQEIDGLHAVLEVIKTVTYYDEIARIAICEHPNWAPLHILLGLLSCSVPLTLKAEILQTLAALAKSKETAISLWNNLEASQIIATIPSTTTYNICNLEMEINQNECRNETYPLTQGILDLLYSLVTTAIPKNLGSNPRKPGLDPYLTFVINGIFLKFYNRTYKCSSERWEVGEKCLKFLLYLLSSYEVTLLDFDEHNDRNSPPGFHIMLQLHTKSDMLRLILLIIDEVRLKLDEYNVFHGKEILENCTLHCLKLLENGLLKQNVFFDAHSAANSSHMLSGLNKLLLDITPRSRQPDHILNIAQFITYSSWLPHHSLAAVKILNMVSKQPTVATQIYGMFTQRDCIQNEIRQGFVECLESDLIAIASYFESTTENNNNIKIELEIKEAIIEFLQNGLMEPSPNISHLLLGFDLMKETHGAAYQKLNAIDNTNNCLKSLVSLLDNHLEVISTTNVSNLQIQRIVERSYFLIYSLCASQRTSDAVLRYLRSCNDFLYRHLNALHLKCTDSTFAYVLNQRCHLVKCAAIELRVTSSHGHISRFQNLCGILVGVSEVNTHADVSMELNHFYFNLSNKLADNFVNKSKSEHSSNFLLCHLLDCLDFEIQSKAAPKWDFFDNLLIEKVLIECELKTKQGQNLINIKKLHQILNDELLTVQNTIASGQRKMIQQEIESVLSYALTKNDARNKNFATVKLIEAWGEICEVLFCCAPESAMSLQTKQDLILEILQKILSKIVPIQPILEISILTSGTILLLLVNLRCIYKQQQELTDSDVDTENKTQRLGSTSASKSNVLGLKLIFKNILEWIIVSGITSQKLRVNLYSALLNCLRIIKGNDMKTSYKPKSEFFVSCLDKSHDIIHTESKQSRAFVDILMACGDKLINIICHDCIAGHEICKMSALSCIDSLLELDCMSSFINLIANRGYLSHIISSLLKSDENLCRTFQNSLDIKALYVYESKMAMLIRIASSHLGAELLLGEKMLSVLSSMKVFDMHPDFQHNTLIYKEKVNDFMPPLDLRFRQILFPALSLCDCIISTLGSENYSATSQIITFLLSHCDMVEVALRTGTPCMELGLLQELSLITGVIARATNQEMFSLGEQHSNQNTTAKLYRIQHLMLSLLSRFIVNDKIFKNMLKTENIMYEATEYNKTLHVKYFLEISANLSLYCRNAVANHSVDHRANVILFSANLSDLFQRNETQNNALKITQSLALVINQLKGSVEYFNSQKYVIENLQRQKCILPNISFGNTARCNSFELTDQLREKEIELSLCTFITDQCLYLLWIHLDFYMRGAQAINTIRPIFKDETYTQDLYNGFSISLEDISVLKKNLISILNETFCKQLISTCELLSEMDKGFNEALLRRIKSLLQFVPVD